MTARECLCFTGVVKGTWQSAREERTKTVTSTTTRIWVARDDAAYAKSALYEALNPVLDAVHPISLASDIARKLEDALTAAYEAGHEAGIHQAPPRI